MVDIYFTQQTCTPFSFNRVRLETQSLTLQRYQLEVNLLRYFNLFFSSEFVVEK
jgi:hypothetical protein